MTVPTHAETLAAVANVHIYQALVDLGEDYAQEAIAAYKTSDAIEARCTRAYLKAWSATRVGRAVITRLVTEARLAVLRP